VGTNTIGDEAKLMTMKRNMHAKHAGDVGECDQLPLVVEHRGIKGHQGASRGIKEHQGGILLWCTGMRR